MKRLRLLRQAAGLTQDELAQMLGVGRTAVTMWETGVNMPTAKLLPHLAAALHCTVDELLADDPD